MTTKTTEKTPTTAELLAKIARLEEVIAMAHNRLETHSEAEAAYIRAEYARALRAAP